MSVLVVGLGHKSASVGTLERAVVSGDALGKLLRDLSQAPNVAGSFVVRTCNRAEVYAEVDKFHGGVVGHHRAAGPALRHPARRADPAPVRALRGPRGAAPARGGLRARLHGGGGEPDTRPAQGGPGHRTRPAHAEPWPG